MSERETNGQFGKGNKVATGNKGGGRSARPKEEQYLAIMLKACSAEDWEKIVISAVVHAKAGDSRAREWLANYIIGKPVERHEISGPEGGPLAVEHILDDATVAEAIRVLGSPNGCQGCGS